MHIHSYPQNNKYKKNKQKTNELQQNKRSNYKGMNHIRNNIIWHENSML